MGRMGISSIRFAQAVRAMSVVARAMELVPPTFASPPPDGLDRSIRRRDDDSCVVSVRLRGRDWEDVVEDIVEGFVEANGLMGVQARRARPQLRRAGYGVED